MEIIKGKWYKNTKWTSETDFCKASGEVSSESIYFTEKIYLGKYYHHDGLWDFLESCVEARFEEYSIYLPDGHPDKIEEWSIGTYVVPIKGYFGNYENGSNKLPLDKIYRIIGNNHNQSVGVSGERFWIYKKNLKWFATEDEALNYLKTKSKDILLEFPTEGHCLSLDSRLINYLKNRPNTLSNKNMTINDKGVGWNSTSFWYIVVTSAKKKYTLSELEKFLVPNEKPIVKEWSIGTYVVFIKEGYLGTNFGLKHHPKTKIGEVHEISNTYYDSTIAVRDIEFVFEKDLVRWFETKTEAEIFANTLKENQMFKKGDYIVTLELYDISSDCAKVNYCFKQSKNSGYLDIELDLEGVKNCNTSLTFDKNKSLKNWRYATKQEIEIYNEIGGPYDVTTIPKKGDYITVINNENEKLIGKYVTDWDNIRFRGPIISNFDREDFKFSNHGVCFASSDRIFRYSTPDEIAWLDECIKENKTVPKPPEFKVGDFVKLKKSLFGFLKNDIGEIKSIGYGKSQVFVPNRESTSALTPNVVYSFSDLEPSTKEEYDKQFLSDTSGSITSRKNVTDFKVGDWVVFEVDRCVGTFKHYKTEAWDRNMVLQVDEINGTSLEFYNKQLNKRYPHYEWYHGGNFKELFRHALPHEIPYDSMVSESDIRIGSVNPCGEIFLPRNGSTKKSTNFPLFIEKTPLPVLIEEKPIKLIKIKKINLSL